MNEIKLPEPGRDSNNWGSSLNNFLRVGHNEDGTPSILGPISSSGLWIDVRDFGVRTFQDLKSGEKIRDMAEENDVAFEAAIRAAIKGPDDPDEGARVCTATVLLPPGDILISKPIRIYSVFNFVLVGCGKSRIMTEEKDLEALLDLNGIADCSFHNIVFTTRNEGSVINMVRLGSNQGKHPKSTRQNTFYNLRVYGKFVNGFNIGYESENLQVDNDLFVHCMAIGQWNNLDPENNIKNSGYFENAMLLGSGTHANNLNHTIINSQFHRCRVGLSNAATNLQVFGGSLDGCEVAYVHASAKTATLTGLRIESSKRLLTSGGIAGFQTTVTLDSIMFSPNQLADDGNWIVWIYSGCLRLNNVLCMYRDDLPADPVMKFLVPSKKGQDGKFLTVIMDGCSTQLPLENAVFKDDEKVDVLVRGYCRIGSGGNALGVVSEARL